MQFDWFAVLEYCHNKTIILRLWAQLWYITFLKNVRWKLTNTHSQYFYHHNYSSPLFVSRTFHDSFQFFPPFVSIKCWFYWKIPFWAGYYMWFQRDLQISWEKTLKKSSRILFQKNNKENNTKWSAQCQDKIIIICLWKLQYNWPKCWAMYWKC